MKVRFKLAAGAFATLHLKRMTLRHRDLAGMVLELEPMFPRPCGSADVVRCELQAAGSASRHYPLACCKLVVSGKTGKMSVKEQKGWRRIPLAKMEALTDTLVPSPEDA